MSGFKLIAITALEGCSGDYCKTLTIGKPYKFYNNYNIEIDNGRILNVQEENSVVPDNLFNLQNGISLNVSAVVGKNGTGKSTLFELIAYATYLLATKKKIKNNYIIRKHSQELKDKQTSLSQDFVLLENWKKLVKNKIKGADSSKSPKSLSAELIEIVRKYNLEIDLINSDSGLDTLNKIHSTIGLQSAQHLKLIEEELKIENDIETKLNISIIYQVGKEIFEIEFFESQFKYSKFSEQKESVCNSIDDFNLPDFFYSIVVNYSHHSYNSVSIGNWVTQLFHKNDAYITPIVINPMRTAGNFNVNHEGKLSRERLLANVVYNLVNKTQFSLINKYKVIKYIFTPKNYDRIKYESGQKLGSDYTFLDLITKKTGIQEVITPNFYWEIAFGYLKNKLIRISDNYPNLIYKKGVNANELLDFLLKDKSHISKKVRQTLNFLELTNTKENLELWEHPEGNVTVTFNEERMFKWLNAFGKDLQSLTPSQLVELALPGFFKIDFELIDNYGKVIKLGNLSSGEQQMILNENSILYHLYNLQSTHQNKQNEEDNIDRIRYEHINIVLDEIELYYHPEMQRKLVNSMIGNLEKVKLRTESGIKSINLCFLTHSPFILSDIPKENILRLSDSSDDGNEPEMETFGANIHEILSDSFFLNDGFVGDFSKRMIQDLINYLNYNPEEKESYTNVKPIEEWDLTKAKKVIEIIGEPFLKEQILNLYYKTIPGRYEKDQKIKELEEELNRLKNA